MRKLLLKVLATALPVCMTAACSSAPSRSAGAGAETVNLIFIHHSCGGNWLRDGLNQALNDAGFHVADTTYGWKEYGDHTDTADWPAWFNDDVMPLVYGEKNAMTAKNAVEPAPGENTVILFKSCYPNSEVGDSIDDEKAIYNSLLPYFERHKDKMFILATPPPMTRISRPERTRELCRWLADRDAGWLKDMKTENVFVFDLYNVLTHPDAHHRMRDGRESWECVEGHDTLYYPTGDDDHPNGQGNKKAAEECIGLIQHWYGLFRG